MWIIPLVGEPPCQCFSPGGIQTTSPALISRIGPPLLWTRPTPEITYSVWPSGCECQFVRAPGSKDTRFETIRAGTSAAMIGSCQTVPVKYSLGASRVGREPARWMFIVFLLFEQEIPHGEEALSRQRTCAVQCAVSNQRAPSFEMRQRRRSSRVSANALIRGRDLVISSKPRSAPWSRH